MIFFEAIVVGKSVSTICAAIVASQLLVVIYLLTTSNQEVQSPPISIKET